MNQRLITELKHPSVIQGNHFTDERGTLRFCNLLDISNFCRFYLVSNNSTSFIRGWQGHKLETKAFYVIKGSFEIHTSPLHNMGNQYDSKYLTQFEISCTREELLIVPGGFATAIRSLELDAQLMVFSQFCLEESTKDDFRFDIGSYPLKSKQ